MAGRMGATISQLEGVSPIPVFFGEDQGRYLVTIPRDKVDWFLDTRIAGTGIFTPWIGVTGGDALKLGDARAVPVKALSQAHEGWFPSFMGGEIAPAA